MQFGYLYYRQVVSLPIGQRKDCFKAATKNSREVRKAGRGNYFFYRLTILPAEIHLFFNFSVM